MILIQLLIACLLVLTLCAGEVQAAESSPNAETIYLDETYISGNQELPKVLYILPWKNQAGGAIPAVKPSSSLERVMTLVYPHEYRLEMAFRAQAGKSKNILSNSSLADGQTKAILKED